MEGEEIEERKTKGKWTRLSSSRTKEARDQRRSAEENETDDFLYGFSKISDEFVNIRLRFDCEAGFRGFGVSIYCFCYYFFPILAFVCCVLWLFRSHCVFF